MRVVIVEDDDLFASTIATVLEWEGWRVEVLKTGDEAIHRFAVPDFDAVILDLGLPDMDGTALLERGRASGMRAPVLVLSARGELSDRLQILGLGADDHLVKPCSTDELVARLKALIRRSSGPRWAPLSCGQVVLCRDDPEVCVGAKRVALSPRERSLLELFLRRQGEILTHRLILSEVFHYDFDPGTNVVVVHVSHLRRKLLGGRVLIETIRGMGYRMTPEPVYAIRDGLRRDG